MKCIECNKRPAQKDYCQECFSETKICSICQVRKSIFKFEKNQRTISGKVSRRGGCKECRKHKKPIPTGKKNEYIKINPPPNIGENFHCPVCERNMIKQYSNQVVLDHNHKTGEIRGWICRDCNSAIGMLGESTSILKRCIKWLGGIISIMMIAIFSLWEDRDNE